MEKVKLAVSSGMDLTFRVKYQFPMGKVKSSWLFVLFGMLLMYQSPMGKVKIVSESNLTVEEIKYQSPMGKVKKSF